MSLNNSSIEIVIVDDVAENVMILSTILMQDGYNVRAFRDPLLALSAIEAEHPTLILLDINMPEMSGYEVCLRLKANSALSSIPIIFISGLSDTSDIVKGFEVGGADYVTKPFQFSEVRARVQTHAKIGALQEELKRHNDGLQRLVEEKIREILQEKERVARAQVATIIAMTKLAEARDDETGHHIERTQEYCHALARHLLAAGAFGDELDGEFVDNIYHAAPLHDIGKVSIPDAILRKPGKLTVEEFETMKSHAVLGAKTLRNVAEQYPHNAFLNMGINIAQAHHEKWNGTGYPDGLAGLEIPLEARIMAVADVYDALRSQRCYKPAFPHEKCRSIMTGDAGMHFEPFLIDAMLEIEDEFKAIHESRCGDGANRKTEPQAE